MKTNFSKRIIWLLLLCSMCFSITAYAAPEISITKGNPGSPVSPPYTFSFVVKDAQGLSSIAVNGRETGPNGTDFYEVDWTTNYNGSFNIVAVNTAGERSLKTVEITNISSAVSAPTQASTPAPTTAAPPTPTVAPTHAPTAAAPPTPTAAPTHAPTAAVPPPSTAAPTVAPTKRVEETTAERIEETITEHLEESGSNSTVADSLEGMVDKSGEMDETINVPDEEKETLPPVTEAPTIPPDSYKLFEGNNQNKTIPLLLICGCLTGMIYCAFTLVLNQRRIKAYKKLQEILIIRQSKKKRQQEQLEEENI